jgi:outer membrane lipoprotein-sorting protein
MRLRTLLPVLLVLAGCTRSAEAPAALLTEVKKRLAERETKLTRYRLEGRTTDKAGEQVGFTFAYRAPQRMHLALGAPFLRTVSWNGEKLFEVNQAQKRFTTFQSELSPEKRAGLLLEVFSPFVPEGFRAPLLPSNAVLKKGSHPRAPETVELTAKVAEPSAQGLEVAYTLRWPSLDFLGKRSSTGDGMVIEVRVEEEHCDEALKLCVPKRVTRWEQGEKVFDTTFSQVELTSSLPNDAFTLTAPEGYDVQTRTLVNADGK